ncbi:MAG: hypothetical protein LBR68_04950, partial [Lachnoclostridium sp.]|nr:hypothetical protein [Lachnoclostridium sp.]
MKINRTSYYTRLSKDEHRLFNVGGAISIWKIDGEKPTEICKIKVLKNPSYLAISSNEKLLAYSNTLGHLTVVEIETGQTIAKTKGTKVEGGNILFFHEDAKILSSDWDGNLFTWDIKSDKITILEELPIITVDLFSCYHENKVIIAGLDSKSKRKYLRLWEMKLEGKLKLEEILMSNQYYWMSIPYLCIVEGECFFFYETKKADSKIYSLDLVSKVEREVISFPMNKKENLYNIEGYYTSICVSTNKRFLILGFS